ncbi:MAG TPA: hypothetical protein VGM63_00285 [Mucilaginibacter sp.]|jgi:hypothetical protein
MYFADISGATNFNIYKGLLDRYLQNQNSIEIRLFFEQIIKVAHELSTGKILQSSIDHTIYNLIIALVDHNKEYNRQYFQNIDPENIGLPQLRTLSGILSSLITPYQELA